MKTINIPKKLSKGDMVRFLSPSSTPNLDAIEKCKTIFESWGLKVDYGQHMLDKIGFLAGSDEDRLSDFNEALRNPKIKGIFATRGGKGAYRIADKLDFKAAVRNPKIVCGFSDITVLHMSLFKECGLIGIHGPLVSWSSEYIGNESVNMLKNALMTIEDIVISPETENPTNELTTAGKTEGIVIGGNLDTIATCAGWALPNLDNKILFIEGVGVGLGHIDRQLTMMINMKLLENIRGIVVGRFTDCGQSGNWTSINVLKHHFERLKVPILGGLPLGHDKNPHTIPIGSRAFLDADSKTLTVKSGVQ